MINNNRRFGIFVVSDIMYEICLMAFKKNIALLGFWREREKDIYIYNIYIYSQPDC